MSYLVKKITLSFPVGVQHLLGRSGAMLNHCQCTQNPPALESSIATTQRKLAQESRTPSHIFFVLEGQSFSKVGEQTALQQKTCLWLLSRNSLQFLSHCFPSLCQSENERSLKQNKRSKDELCYFEPFTRRQILDWSKLKQFADDNFEFDENIRKFSRRVEDTVGKGEIARYEQFSLFPQCFQKACTKARGVKRCHCVGMG